MLVLVLGRSHPGCIDPPRYEPLPGVAELPAWVWRRAGRSARLGAVLVLLAALAVAVAIVPAMRDAARAEDDALQR